MWHKHLTQYILSENTMKIDLWTTWTSRTIWEQKMEKHQRIRLTAREHGKESLTSWDCAAKKKWSDGLHRSIKNSHLLSENVKWSDELHKSIKISHLHTKDVQTRRNDQMDFTEASETLTYILRMFKQRERIRWTSQKHQKQWLTSWGYADKEKWWDGLHRSIMNIHLHPEDVQTRKNDQIDSTEASRTVTYMLKMCRQEEIIKWTLQKHQEQSLTCWKCADKEKWSDGLHRSIRNSDLHPEYVQTRKNDQMDFTEASETVTYILSMCKQGKMIRQIPQKH